ncbi:NUDIX domain-containing protein [Agrococcus sp. ARC_14]|uniref:NUDIX hydrolase n=1 Tax=Agrococcus sp. ARC_14 TaxID=2919927 RepID=UPI001F064107|nr:NUDIX domain-containing protein [Agrococcus sp. ARC_14]MCH1883956.1 NUDIX domain-containing protein [Agrococcus sp. ARC_14]
MADRKGKQLTDYPRPSVAVDTAVLTVAHGQLCVGLLTDGRSPKRRLPGTFLHEGETLADAVRRSLREKAGIEGVEPVQLHVFDAPGRDTRGWVITVANLATVRADAVGSLPLIPVGDAAGLDFDHDDIVKLAAMRLRADYSEHPDPAGLLTQPFKIGQLRELHAAVAGELSQPDTFRRRMLPRLSAVGIERRGSVGKPAALFRRITID